MKNNYKQSPIRRCVNEFYYVVPAGLLELVPTAGRFAGKDEEKIPHGCGVIECFHDQRKQWLGKLRARIVRRAAINLLVETPRDFIDALVRRTLYGQVASGERAVTWRGRSAVTWHDK